MKSVARQFFLISVAAVLFYSCEKDKEQAPELPPYETMVIDFSNLSNAAKAASIKDSESLSKINWTTSAATAGVWWMLLTTTLVVPVASFYQAFNHSPVKIDDEIWQWSYAVDGFTSKYTARLVGEQLSGDVKWEMYITKEGTDPFSEFMWFVGSSATDGNSGNWTLYHSPQFPELVILVDWKKEGNEVGEVKYTYSRKLNNNRETDKFYGSYLIYGLQDKTYGAYVNIHAFNAQKNSFTDTFIEWSRTDYSGRIKAEHYFIDPTWHCWDNAGNDVACP